MIKVNLLPAKEKKKRKEFLIGFAVVVALLIVALGMFWIYVQRVRVKSDLKKEIAQIDEESKGYTEKIAEIKELEQKEASLEAFKKTVKGISEIQRKVIVGVDQMALAMPDGIWLSSLTQGKTTDVNKFAVNGYSFSAASLRTYLDSLQRTAGLLKDGALDIKSINASAGNNRQIYQFEISAKVADQGL